MFWWNLTLKTRKYRKFMRNAFAYYDQIVQNMFIKQIKLKVELIYVRNETRTIFMNQAERMDAILYCTGGIHFVFA